MDLISINNDISPKRPDANKPQPFQVVNIPFNKEDYSAELIKFDNQKVENWPVVYILTKPENRTAYVGQTTRASSRMGEHLSSKEKDFNRATIIFHDESNVSSITDYEHLLIQYMQADKQFTLINGNGGWEDKDYFSKYEYNQMFVNLWEKLRETEITEGLSLASHSLKEIEESEIFKYSPYKNLSPEQARALKEIMKVVDKKFIDLKNNKEVSPIVVEGMPGTGKTILMFYMFKYLVDNEKYKDLNIKLIEPDWPLRRSLQSVAGTIKGLKAKDIIGPYGLKKEKVDILFVDEAHKLKFYKSLSTSFKAYKDVCKDIFGPNAEPNDISQIDWILATSKIPIIFYDHFQKIRPNNIHKSEFDALIKKSESTINLTTQMRLKSGEEYLGYVRNILNCEQKAKMDFSKNYEFILHESFEGFHASFNDKKKEYPLTRMIAGYAWEWKSKNKPSETDIEIEGTRLRWNSTRDNWIGKGFDNPEISEEVGCIHTVQGFDLSYAYVIIGEDLELIDSDGQILRSNKDQYFDKVGKQGLMNEEELDSYIKNIYYVLLTRGIYGTHVYVCNPQLREYFKKFTQ